MGEEREITGEVWAFPVIDFAGKVVLNDRGFPGRYVPEGQITSFFITAPARCRFPAENEGETDGGG